MSDETVQPNCSARRFLTGVLLDMLGVAVCIGAIENAICHSGQVAGILVGAVLIGAGTAHILPRIPCDHPGIYRT